MSYSRFVTSTLLLLSIAAASRGQTPLPTAGQLLKQHKVSLTRPSLIAALRNPDAEVRYLAAQQLAEERASDAIPNIIKALESEKMPRATANIAFALAQMDVAQGVIKLKALCVNPRLKGQDRLLATQYLLDLQVQDCRNTIFEYLQADNDQSAKIQSMYLARRLQNSPDDAGQLVKLIAASLRDHVPAVRLAASDTLAALGNGDAVPLLEAAIDEETDESVRSKMRSDLQALGAGPGREVSFVDCSHTTSSPMTIIIAGGTGTVGSVGGDGTSAPPLVKLESRLVHSKARLFEVKITNVSHQLQVIPWDLRESDFEPSKTTVHFSVMSATIKIEERCENSQSAVVTSVSFYAAPSKSNSVLKLKPGDWGRLLLAANAPPVGCILAPSDSMSLSISTISQEYRKQGDSWTVSSKPVPLSFFKE
jgi:hypothetical protein